MRGDKSQRDFASLLKVNHQLISDYETGKSKPTLNFFGLVAKELDINLNWLVSGEGDMYAVPQLKDTPMKNVNSVPVVGSIACGIPIKEWKGYGEKFEPMVKIGHLNFPFLLKASGDSMKPYVLPGDLLLFSDNAEFVKEGRPVAISFKSEPDTHESYVKILRFEGKDSYIAYSYNPDYKPTTIKKKDIYKLYPLIKIIREVK